jgi:hypothetical protein
MATHQQITDPAGSDGNGLGALASRYGNRFLQSDAPAGKLP